MSTFPDMLTSLSTNPYFSAGFGLLGLGTGLAILKVGWRQMSVIARRQMLVSLEIPSRDRSYEWVLQWMSKQSTFGSGLKTQHLSVQTTVQQYETGMMVTRFDFLPSPGRHVLVYKGVCDCDLCLSLCVSLCAHVCVKMYVDVCV